jgi:hypothetical protein
VGLRRLTEPLRFLGPGFHPHLPGFKHQFLAKTLGATMWFFIFYRARCVTLAYILTTSDSLSVVHRQDGAKLLVRPVVFHCTPLAHLRFVGIEPPMGGPRTRQPRRTWSHTLLDLFLSHFCTNVKYMKHRICVEKVPELLNYPGSTKFDSPNHLASNSMRVYSSGAQLPRRVTDSSLATNLFSMDTNSSEMPCQEKKLIHLFMS